MSDAKLVPVINSQDESGPVFSPSQNELERRLQQPVRTDLKHGEHVRGLYQGDGLVTVLSVMSEGTEERYIAKFDAEIVPAEMPELELQQGEHYEFRVVKVGAGDEPDYASGKSADDRSTGLTLLSIKEVLKWQMAETWLRDGAEVEAKVRRFVPRAGLEVSVEGEFGRFRGFIPLSQLGQRNLDDQQLRALTGLIGDKRQKDGQPPVTLKARVIGIDRQKGGLTLSHRSVLLEEVKKNLTEKLFVGQVLPGTITKTKEFGAFIDIGVGIEALLPRSHMGHLKSLKEGMVVEVEVIAIDVNNSKITLSTRRLSHNHGLDEERFAVGSVHQGTIANINKSGVFVAVDGFQGIVPLRELCGEPKKGDRVKVKVIDYSRDGRRLTFSVKEANREQFFVSTNEGDVFTGTVLRIAEVGAFIALDSEPRYDGLLHVSRYQSLQQGDRVKVRVLQLNPDRGQVRLDLVEIIASAAQPEAA